MTQIKTFDATENQEELEAEMNTFMKEVDVLKASITPISFCMSLMYFGTVLYKEKENV